MLSIGAYRCRPEGRARFKGERQPFPTCRKNPAGWLQSIWPEQDSAEYMTKIARQRILTGFCAWLLPAFLAMPASAGGETSAHATMSVTVDTSEAMFTTMCALLASGFEADVSAQNWHALRAQLRERMQQQQGPAVEALRDFYKKHQLVDAGAMLSEYIWFGLVSGPAPKFQPILRRDELPPEVIALDGFSEILSAYYQEQKIGQLWRQLEPNYNREIDHLHDGAARIVFVTTNYLREMPDSASGRTFQIIVEPLVGRITNVRNLGDHYAIILSGLGEVPVDVVRHAYLHFLLDPLPLQYWQVVAAKRPLFEIAARAPRLATDLKDDFASFFTECTVRAVELKLGSVPASQREAFMNRQDADGYVLVRPIYLALEDFGKSEQPMKRYFPELVRAIDTSREAKRLQAVNFVPADSGAKTDESSESVAHRPRPPSTVPNDAEAIAALTDGERRIAEKNPRAAEASFQKVLAKYPDQTRAWYGLGLVALLDHDGPRATEVFTRLTAGEHAATRDPMVLAWAHVYLGRIYGDQGQVEQARSEYRAALSVSGGPEQARQAAQTELAAFESKPPERP